MGYPDIAVGTHRSLECSWERIGDSDNWLLVCPVIDADFEETWFRGVTNSATVFSVDGAPCSVDSYLGSSAGLYGYTNLTVEVPGVISRMEYATDRGDG